MSIDFKNVKKIVIPQGEVKQIKDYSGITIWTKSIGDRYIIKDGVVQPGFTYKYDFDNHELEPTDIPFGNNNWEFTSDDFLSIYWRASISKDFDDDIFNSPIYNIGTRYIIEGNFYDKNGNKIKASDLKYPNGMHIYTQFYFSVFPRGERQQWIYDRNDISGEAGTAIATKGAVNYVNSFTDDIAQIYDGVINSPISTLQDYISGFVFRGYNKDYGIKENASGISIHLYTEFRGLMGRNDLNIYY